MTRTRTLAVSAVAAVAALTLVGAGAVAGASAVSARSSAAAATDGDSLSSAFTALAFGDDETQPGQRQGFPGMGGMHDRMHRGDGMGRRGADRMLHGEVVVKDKDGQPMTVALQRGEVTKVTSDSVTARSEDGYERTWRLTGETVYRAFRAEAGKADVVVGADVRLMGTVSGDQATARLVGIPPADAGSDGGGSGSTGATSTA
jgi:hypothetical protein